MHGRFEPGGCGWVYGRFEPGGYTGGLSPWYTGGLSPVGIWGFEPGGHTGGLSPFGPHRLQLLSKVACVAQWIARLPPKEKVAGSNPASGVFLVLSGRVRRDRHVQVWPSG